MGKFLSDLETFEKAAIDKADLATRMIALEVFRRIIMKTPVDTGRARGNWLCSIAVPAAVLEDTPEWFKGEMAQSFEFDKSGRATIQAAVDEVMSWNPRDVAIYLTNNLPYISVLEHGGFPSPVKRGTYMGKGKGYKIKSAGGYSIQAPAGMVAVTIAEFDGIARAVLK